MEEKSLTHKSVKDSTVKWFIFAIIPIVNLYWLWKAAEVVSGHEKEIREQHEVIGHMDVKDSTAKWFAISLLPAVSVVILLLAIVFGMFLAARGMIFHPAILGVGFALLPILVIVALVAGIYVLYKMAESVSGHETVYPKEHETVGHKDVKDSTGKWLVFGLVPILNIYFVWKMSETISGHEEIVGESGSAEMREPAAEPSEETGREVRYCPNCGSEIEEGTNFCPECGDEI